MLPKVISPFTYPFGSGSLQSLDFDNLFSANFLFAKFLSGLSQPIFIGRKIKTAFEISKAQQEQARLDFQQSVLNASKEVSSAMVTLDSASQKTTITKRI